jgi:Zn-dependent protease with chaperone function
MARIDFFDGSSAIAHEAKISVHLDHIVIHAGAQTHRIMVNDIRTTLSTPNGRRFFQLPHDMMLEFHDNQDAEVILERLQPEHLKKERWFNQNYRTKRFLTGALVAFVGLIALLYFYVLPATSAWIASKVPADVFDKVSQAALKELTTNNTLKPSKLPEARQAQLRAQFNQLKKPDTSVPFKLHFYSAPDIGPNAFALPSGDVILLDELVNITQSDAQTMGVLSHELGHVALHHSARGIVQDSIVGFALAAWMGDYGSTVVNLAAATVANQKYSRDFEREADDYAIKMLKLNQISPAVLADFFVVMEQSAADERSKDQANQAEKPVNKTTSTLEGLIQSHPPTAERIEALRKAAQE